MARLVMEFMMTLPPSSDILVSHFLHPLTDVMCSLAISHQNRCGGGTCRSSTCVFFSENEAMIEQSFLSNIVSPLRLSTFRKGMLFYLLRIHLQMNSSQDLSRLCTNHCLLLYPANWRSENTSNSTGGTHV